MKKSAKDKLAFVISTVFLPPVMVALAILAISIYYSGRYNDFWLWAILGILLLIGPASIYVYTAYRKGRVSDINLSEREERLRPLIIALIGAVVGTWILLREGMPESLLLLGITLISELVIVMFVTMFWKISLHTLAYASSVTMLAYLYNKYAIILFIFLVPIAWARIYRKRHTLLQTVAGSLVGIITALAVFILFNYPAK